MQALHGHVDCFVDVVVTGPVVPRRVGTGLFVSLFFVILGFCQTIDCCVGGWFVFG